MRRKTKKFLMVFPLLFWCLVLVFLPGLMMVMVYLQGRSE